MKLGKKQKAYGAVLALAAVGFVVDRLFFAPPSSEAANVGDAPVGPTGAPAVSGPAEPRTAVEAQAAPAGWLAARFRAAPGGSDNDLRDVFVIPASWRPTVKSLAAAPKAELLGEQFRKEHHLEAVVIDGKRGRAVVDGQLVPIGGAVAGFRLVAITQRSAEFVHGDEHVSLTLTDAADASGGGGGANSVR